MELTWVKSTRSGGNQDCVEVAGLPGGARAVRDSKNPTGPALRVTAATWATFVDGLRDTP